MDNTQADRIRSSSVGQAAVSLRQFVKALWQQILQDRIEIRASGLAFSSLLAAVPLAAVLFALFTAFGAFEDLIGRVRDLLLSQLIPTRLDEIAAHLDRFVENSERLGFVGFVGLAVTAILLLDGIESNFNDIWHVTRRRRLVSKLTAYTSVLVFGTILIGVSVSVSAWLRANLLTNAEFELPLLSALGSWLGPLAASFLAFLLMYIIVPSTRVRLASAAVGGLVAAVAWEAGKYLFALSVGQSVRYSTLYGSLAVFPIFLVWLYVTWIIVLVGLEVAFTHQNFRALVQAGGSEQPRGRRRLELAVALYALVAERFDRGGSPLGMSELAEGLVVAPGVVADLVQTLAGSGLLHELVSDSDEAAVVPAMSLDRVRVADVVGAVYGGTRGRSAARGPFAEQVGAVVAQFDAGGREAIGDLTFRDLLDRVS